MGDALLAVLYIGLSLIFLVLAVGSLLTGESMWSAVLIVAALAFLYLAFRRRPWRTVTVPRSHKPRRQTKSATTKPRKRPAQRHTYDEFKFGDPSPTRKQFSYAMSLGVEINDGMTKQGLSRMIDVMLELQQENEPATEEQLSEIRTYHGVLARPITRGEARDVIFFLQDHSLLCPFCGIEIFAGDEECCACERKLDKLRIPIKLD